MIPSSTVVNTKLEIVLDTNQILSGFLYHGMSRLIFDLVLNDQLKLFVSPALKTEVLNKLDYFKVNKQVQNEILNFLEVKGVLVEPEIIVKACRDPEDNFILELAETAQ